MKRTNLVLDEELLKTAVRLLGAKTYSAAVNQALEEVIRVVKARGITQFIGSGIWEGNLSKMREDKSPKKRGR
jgi:uncharacterized protein YunC (DUF1805 family)